jgi:hypothetical protein
MVGGNVEIRALYAFVYLFMRFVLHIEWVVSLNRIDYDFFRQLYSKTIFVDRNLLNVVTAANFYTCLRHKVLNDYIGHQFAVCISFLVEAVDTVEVNFV